MRKKIAAAALACMLAVSMLVFAPLQPAQAAASDFSDVPSDSWAVDVINSAVQDGLMQGMGGGVFGYNRTITNAEFVTALCRMFSWNLVSPAQASFTDVGSGDWFYAYIETGVVHGVFDGGGKFSPGQPIDRETMAVWLVRALGYEDLAQQAGQTNPPAFADTADPDVTFAASIGMVNGIGNGQFAPQNTAKREEAAAILVRIYDKLQIKTNWVNGFYAISSYGQRSAISGMNAVTFGWSAMEWDAQNGARLNTTAGAGNQWCIPDSYELVADAPRQAGAKANMGVYMDAAMGLPSLLADANARHAAVSEIVQEATRVYGAIGRSPYDGVTIDFEGLFAPSKSGFTAFVTELSAALHNSGRSLYVTVQPVTTDGQYFNGYDYRAIGQAADKVILMAYDYQPLTLNGFVGTEWEKNTALTPIAEVYKALLAAVDPNTGVADTGKLALGVSYASVGWKIDGSGKVADPNPVMPSLETVQQRMAQPDTVFGWSAAYRNPYIIYTTETGDRVFLWYENARSVGEKLTLANLFGVTGESVWRIGIIPNF